MMKPNSLLMLPDTGMVKVLFIEGNLMKTTAEMTVIHQGCKSKQTLGPSLTVQRSRHHASTAGGTRLISGWGTKIPHAAWCGQTVPPKQNQTHLLDANTLLKINNMTKGKFLLLKGFILFCSKKDDIVHRST